MDCKRRPIIGYFPKVKTSNITEESDAQTKILNKTGINDSIIYFDQEQNRLNIVTIYGL